MSFSWLSRTREPCNHVCVGHCTLSFRCHVILAIILYKYIFCLAAQYSTLWGNHTIHRSVSKRNSLDLLSHGLTILTNHSILLQVTEILALVKFPVRLLQFGNFNSQESIWTQKNWCLCFTEWNNNGSAGADGDEGGWGAIRAPVMQRH